MDGWDVTSGRPIVSKSPFGCGWSLEINHELSQVPLFDQINYLLFQLKIVFHIVAMIIMKLTIFILISLEGIGLDLSRTLHKFLIFDLYKYLGDGGVERW